MRWKITIGCLLLLGGVGVFVYGATRHATNVRLSQEMRSALGEIFWDDNAPISVHRNHEELLRPVGHLMNTLYDLGGKDCWGVEALAVCYVGVVAVFLGVLMIRSDVLKRCVPTGPQTADIAAVRAAGRAVLLFRAAFFFWFVTPIIVVGNNFLRWWSNFLNFPPPGLTEFAFICVYLVRIWIWPAMAVLLVLVSLGHLVYMRVLKSRRRRWRWLWEMPVDWCLGIVFLSLFFWALYIPFAVRREYDSTVFELICPSEEAETEEAQIADIIRKAGMPCYGTWWKFSREEALAIPEWPEWKDWVKAHQDRLPEQMAKLTVRCRRKDKSACERLLRDYVDHKNEVQKAATPKSMDSDKK